MTRLSDQQVAEFADTPSTINVTAHAPYILLSVHPHENEKPYTVSKLAIPEATALMHLLGDAIAVARDTCLICGKYDLNQGQECTACTIAEDAAAIRREDRTPE